MPLLIPATESMPGMELVDPFVYRGRMMLPAGRPLSDSDVRILNRQYGRHQLRIHDPVLDEALEFDDDSGDQAVAESIKQQIAKTVRSLHDQMSSRHPLKGLDYSPYRQLVVEAIDEIRQSGVARLLPVQKAVESDDCLADRVAETFYTAMVLAVAARDYVIEQRIEASGSRQLSRRVAEDVIPLGLGMIFMDLALHKAEHLLRKQERLTPEEHQLIVEHPTVAARLLPESFPPTARMVVRTHHENLYGTGYPMSLPGHRLHVFTRVVRVADAFTAATALDMFEQARSPVQALWEMTQGPYQRFYDPKLTEALAQMVRPFPIGSKLTLTDGSQAVVVSHREAHSLEPTVIVAFDHNGRRLETHELTGPVTLSRQGGLRIASFQGQDAGFLYGQDLEDQPVVPPLGGFETGFEALYP